MAKNNGELIQKIQVMNHNAYITPTTVLEALTKAGECEKNYIYFGGGTDIQSYHKQGLLLQNNIIDLSEISELHNIDLNDNVLRIGSMVTLDELINSNIITENLPMILKAAKSVATPVIRKTATIGGNLLVMNRCTFYNQSKDWRKAIGSCLRESGDICRVTESKSKCYARNVSDMAPALIVLDAEAIIQNQNSVVTIPLMKLYASNGIHPHQNLNEDGIIVGVKLTPKPGKWWYQKLRLRRSLDFTSLTVAATVNDDKIARICINGVSMAPVLIKEELSKLTTDGLQKQSIKACKMVDNDFMPLGYRREMLKIYLNDWWDSVQ